MILPVIEANELRSSRELPRAGPLHGQARVQVCLRPCSASSQLCAFGQVSPPQSLRPITCKIQLAIVPIFRAVMKTERTMQVQGM